MVDIVLAASIRDEGQRIQMLATVLIITVSVALGLYWFRYCCLGLLRSYTEQPDLVADQRYSFNEVRQRLETELDLTPLHQSLDRDYRIVSYLLEHAAGLATPSIEHRLLLVDYRLMQAWYGLTRLVAPAQARKALAERAAILGCLARMMGEQAGLRSEA